MDEHDDPLRLLLDIGPAVHQAAGLSRYAHRLATHLAHMGTAVDLTLFYNVHSGHGVPPDLHGLPAITLPVVQPAWRIGALLSQWMGRNHALQKQCIEPARSTLYHATEHLLPRIRCKSVLTVHDLIFERYPQHHTLRNRIFLKLAMPRFVAAADAIIAVSKQTRDDLVLHYRTAPTKVHVIYEGIDPTFRPAAAADVERVRGCYSPERPYLLMVGTLEPRKNHLLAMRALARLKADGRNLQLLIVGGKGWMFEPIRAQVNALGLEADVTFAGHIPDADLPPLYSGAVCLLQPSLFEGFGFPVLEAMACAAPVICSNVSSLPEVAGDVALLIDPLDEAALAAAIVRVLDEPGLATQMRRLGPAHAAQFTWQKCALKTLELYQTLT